MFERLNLLVRRVLPEPALRLFEGFWATPLVIAACGVALVFPLQLAPDSLVGRVWVEFFATVDLAGGRAALSVIAGGMISLIALVFSLTFVALSNTAQQLSPRILDYVLQERSGQQMLGFALGAFLFSVLSLAVGDVRGAWRLGLAVLTATALASATLILVVAFAHSMTRVLRAEELVARLGSKFTADLRRVLKPPAGCRRADGDPAAFEGRFGEAAAITTQTAGYVGLLDYDSLIAFAARRDIGILLEVRESQFLLPGDRIAQVIGLHDDSDDPTGPIASALNLSDRREATDVAGYQAAALCEAALRALSPGVNDPATAISCLNRLFEGLALLTASAAPPRLLAGSDGVPRLLRPPRETPEYLENVVAPILAAARGDERVLECITARTRRLARIATRQRDRDAIGAFLAQVERTEAEG